MDKAKERINSIAKHISSANKDEKDSAAPNVLEAAVTTTQTPAKRKLALAAEKQKRESWADAVEELETRRKLAAVLNEEDPGIQRQRLQGKLTARERVALILDAGSLREWGSTAGKAIRDPKTGKLKEFVRANFVAGRGKIRGKDVIVGADDFSVRGGHADGGIARKSLYTEQMAIELRLPLIRLLDGSSGGGSVTTYLSTGRTYIPAMSSVSIMNRLLKISPVGACILGPAVGAGAARATLTHFVVAVAGLSQLFAAGPPVVQYATFETVTKEELGGSHIMGANGTFDNIVGSELEAFETMAKWLSYLPTNRHELPARIAPPKAIPDQSVLLNAIPKKRQRQYDPRTAYLSTIMDPNTFFEIGTHWGNDLITGFARLDGWSVGVIAGDPRFNGGATSAAACHKVNRFVQICDQFNLPICNFNDCPGFAVGTKAEAAGTIRAGSRLAVTVYDSTVPWYTVIVRRLYGVAGAILGCRGDGNVEGGGINVRCAWPSAEWGSLPLEGGIEAAYKKDLIKDPSLRERLLEQFREVASPFLTAEAFDIEEMVSPADTRELMVEWVNLVYKYRLPERLAKGGSTMTYAP
ncbi:acetyl-CoA carboxylase [Synchytrium microbalum]|uniref:Propionyl-CoA carboxylase beta chain, mitochondrial n=1 Tax=Synchytrium microbalum TaxID=1806994 RepID=A0A507C4Q7_9FUNG|nr:acetyl-CoA carboxylase [Synchytrium microbalum]TPX34662.1 acetyl-CoA carboxylase [Synchytrium microbalum]